MKNTFYFLLTILFVSVYGSVQAQDFTVNKSREGVEVMENGKKVLFYQQRPKSHNGQYERAGYVHPLYSMDETVITEDFPEDHLHHRGIFWAWHQILWHGGQIADGWVSDNVDWVVKEVKVEENQNTLTLKPTRIWRSIISVKELKPIIKEKTSITVHPSNSDYRLIDFEIQLNALVDGLQLGGSDNEKGYGGFSLRFKLPKDIKFISEHKEVEPQRTAVTAGPWMDFNGSFAGEDAPKSGVAVFNHPSNPEPHWDWILRDSGSMQNPVFPGREPVNIPKDGLTLKYRLVVHKGDAGAVDLDTLYEDYKNDKGATKAQRR